MKSQNSSRLIPSKSALKPKLRNDPASPIGARERVPISSIGLWQITEEAIAKNNWWQMFLIAVDSASSIIYPHVPLVSFAAVAGNTLTRKKALISAMSIWLANQLYGFAVRQYPITLESLTWGLVMGLGMLTVTWLVTALRPQFSRCNLQGYSLWLAISLIGGYAIY